MLFTIFQYMPRQLWVEQHHPFKHITNRGARRQDLFFDDQDRGLFLDLVGRAVQRSSIKIHAFCLMHNHFHFIVESEGLDASKAFQWLQGSYARWFNDRHSFDGSLFKGRFHSEEVIDDGQLIAATAYVHRNPQEVGIDARAHLWSSYGAYLGQRRCQRWLSTDLLGDLVNTRDHVLLVEGEGAPIVKKARLQPLPPFRTNNKEATAAVCERVETAVCLETGATPVELRTGRSWKMARSRTVLLLILLDDAGVRAADICSRYGMGNERSVWKAARRGRVLVQEHSEFGDLYWAVRVRHRWLAAS